MYIYIYTHTSVCVFYGVYCICAKSHDWGKWSIGLYLATMPPWLICPIASVHMVVSHLGSGTRPLSCTRWMMCCRPTEEKPLWGVGEPAQTDYQQWPCPFHPPSSPRRHSSGMVAMGSRECACLAALSQGGSKHCLQHSSVCHPAGSLRNWRSEHGATENPECVDLVQWSPDGWWRCQPCSLACRQASSLSWRKVQHYISNKK